MTSEELKRIESTVESAIVRADIYGNVWVTLWRGDFADAYVVDPENEKATKELLLRLEERKGGKK